ncbi:MAG: CYTH domain-containing protein [Chthoniobacterales bacterium]
MPEHREIERKFLVRELPEKLEDFAHVEIEQGYLAIEPDRAQVRLRKAGEKLSLTYKRNEELSREEREITLTPEQFAVLWPGTADRRLRKTRYNVPLVELVVEIDVYHERHEGLIVAEVEFENEEEARAFQPPPWLGEDVSFDSRYSNQLLAD